MVECLLRSVSTVRVVVVLWEVRGGQTLAMKLCMAVVADGGEVEVGCWRALV